MLTELVAEERCRDQDRGHSGQVRGPEQMTERRVLFWGIVGAVAGVLLVVAPMQLAQTPPLGPGSSLSFTLNLSNTSEWAGSYFYNLSFVLLSSANVTAAWTQFMVYAPAPLTRVNITVLLISSDGVELAFFNSSRSTWNGSNPGGPLTDTAMGGWAFGSTEPVAESDHFQVVSTQSLSGRELAIAMSVATSPHSSEEEWLPV